MTKKTIFIVFIYLLISTTNCLDSATKKECLDAHNALRKLHVGTPPLVWDERLAADAQRWAEHLLKIGRMKHMHPNKDGENLAYGVSSSGPRPCADAVLAWYNEISDYSYKTGNTWDGHPIGHFTQVTWRDTKRVGVGIATKTVNGRTTTFIVGRYAPKGNFIMMKWGEKYGHARTRVYSEEVEPRKKGSHVPTLQSLEQANRDQFSDDVTVTSPDGIELTSKELEQPSNDMIYDTVEVRTPFKANRDSSALGPEYDVTKDMVSAVEANVEDELEQLVSGAKDQTGASKQSGEVNDQLEWLAKRSQTFRDYLDRRRKSKDEYSIL